MQQLHPNNPSFMFCQEVSGSSCDYGALEEAIASVKQPLYNTNRPAATLEMFPSWPIRFQQTLAGSSKSGDGSTDSGSAVNAESPISRKLLFSSLEDEDKLSLPPLMQATSELQRCGSEPQPSSKRNPEKRRGPIPNSDKALDAKSLKRLAQNREAAKRSRLRKKAYVQQLESSRLRLNQLEQDLHRARSQGAILGGGNASSGMLMFHMEYARWLDDDHRQITELRTALQTHLSDCDLRVIVDNYISHYDEMFRLKGAAAKSDVLHLFTGMWTTSVERCFLWLGGFRPSDLIKVLMSQLNPLSEQQVMGIYSLQQSSLQAEEALSQGLDQLLLSVTDTISSGSSITENMHHYMFVALGKVANLEGFLRQADNLRQQTLHQLRRMLTVRQAARCFLVIGEYNSRLRALSSLWASRPLE